MCMLPKAARSFDDNKFSRKVVGAWLCEIYNQVSGRVDTLDGTFH